MNLKEVLISISQGDEAAFKQLFEHFFPGLLTYSTSVLKGQHLAEEVVADVFISLWEKRRSILEIRNISFYLYKAVRYASMKALIRQKKCEVMYLDEMRDFFSFSCTRSASSLVSKENCQRISEAISLLPPKCKLIFRLVKEEGMKYKEVSQLLNLSEKTIENQITIALKKLIKSFNETLPEFSYHISSNTSCLLAKKA